MRVRCGLHEVLSSLTSLLGAEEIGVRTPIENPIEDMLSVMHWFLGCVSNTNGMSQIMDCCPVSVSLGTQDHWWWFVIDVATLHLHTSACTCQSFFLEHPFTASCQLNFPPKSGSNVITPHLLKQNNSLPFLFPLNDLFIFHQFYVIVCIHVFTYRHAPNGPTFCI